MAAGARIRRSSPFQETGIVCQPESRVISKGEAKNLALLFAARRLPRHYRTAAVGPQCMPARRSDWSASKVQIVAEMKQRFAKLVQQHSKMAMPADSFQARLGAKRKKAKLLARVAYAACSSRGPRFARSQALVPIPNTLGESGYGLSSPHCESTDSHSRAICW